MKNGIRKSYLEKTKNTNYQYEEENADIKEENQKEEKSEESP